MIHLPLDRMYKVHRRTVHISNEHRLYHKEMNKPNSYSHTRSPMPKQ